VSYTVGPSIENTYTVNSPPRQSYCSPWQSPQQLTAWSAPAAWPAADCPCLGRTAVAGPCLAVPPAAPAQLAPLPAAVPEHIQLFMRSAEF
jgi:hypothetical protein